MVKKTKAFCCCPVCLNVINPDKECLCHHVIGVRYQKNGKRVITFKDLEIIEIVKYHKPLLEENWK